MNQTIEARMQHIENEIKAIRKELDESLGMYKTSFLKPIKKTTRGKM